LIEGWRFPDSPLGNEGRSRMADMELRAPVGRRNLACVPEYLAATDPFSPRWRQLLPLILLAGDLQWREWKSCGER